MGTPLSNGRTGGKICPTSSTFSNVDESDLVLMADSTSPVGLEVLDELRIRVLELQLVLVAVQYEVDLNFDEIFACLHPLQQLSKQAFGAASILSQEAALDASWSTGPSRPKAVFARHSAAVRDGASRVIPKTSLIDTVEDRLRQPPVSDFSHEYRGPKPRCTAIVASTGKPCRGTAIYLGSGSFAEHCNPHWTQAEKDAYQQHFEEQHIALAEAEAQRDELLRNFGRSIIDDWLQHRESGSPWLAALADL